MAPRLACQAFVTVEDVLSAKCACELNEADDGALIAEYIDEASDMLYVLSGGRVFGICERQVWPIKTGECYDGPERTDWVSWDSVDSIPLPGPDTNVIEVTIDGIALNPSEYGLIDGHKLFRRSGCWPVSNDVTKADTQAGTFTITVRFGAAVRELARRAAIELVCQMVTNDNAAINRMRGVVSATVQGVSVQLDDDPVGQMGLPEVNRFLDVYASRGMGALGVYSPELSHGWRLISVTGGSGS